MAQAVARPEVPSAVVGRIQRTADFERVLALAPRARSAHFAAHHLPTAPSSAFRPVRAVEADKLSTGDAPSCPPGVDSSAGPAVEAALSGYWLGTVVPKRHARRAVTRTLVKRQMRAVMAAGAAQLPPGLWVLRLKSVFDPKQFTSAASAALRQQVRGELQLLLQRALLPGSRATTPARAPKHPAHGRP